MRTLRLLLAATLAASTVAMPMVAYATPWSEGVPQATQDQANKLFDEGNQLFAQQQHLPAAEKYEAAVKLWDHPLIEFNLAVTLIRLEKPLEAAEALEKALRFGEQPFKPELYQQALDYQALLKNQVGYVEAACTQVGVKVRVDGKPWFDCPGTQKMRIISGEHIIDGELKDYVPATSGRVVVSGGNTAHHDVKMRSIDSAVVLTYKYPRWVPYTVTGAGAAIGLVGLAVWLAGRSQMNDFEEQFRMDCPSGCEKNLDKPEHSLLKDQRDSAELKGNIGIGMMIGGGAVLVGGVVLTIMNRPTRELPKLEVSPTNGGATASTTIRF
ncbi:MAG TPA: tetratricopeptide repeat protein [Kofleriaceae bacterium]